MHRPPPFVDIESRVAAYRAGRDAFADLSDLYARLEGSRDASVVISLVPRPRAFSLLAEAAKRRENGEKLPLFGIPFAVKDNIDVAGAATTAACPAFAFEPEEDAAVVQRLIVAGATPVAKTNLDQFATGLSGARSPYGLPSSAFSARHVSGGSSSGSAVAVASGLVPFALGTDTAGSGRVPAGFNNLVGLKPTRGLLSNRGLVPACRSLDCISIFAASVADARLVATVAAGEDPADGYSRAAPADLWAQDVPSHFRFGVVGADVLARCSPDIRDGYARSIHRLKALDGIPVAVDYAPFEEAARLLYEGPWVAERLAAIKDFAARDPGAIHPVVRDIVLSGARHSAVDAFEGQYRLAGLIREVAPVWDAVDILLVPTAPEHPTIDAMLADPVGCNARLGLFTNFVNLMDLAALAVPAGFAANGLPVGVTLVGPAFSDGLLARLGDRLHRADPEARLASGAVPLSAAAPVEEAPKSKDEIALAVVGAHLRGQPLNHQLTTRNARFLGQARTGEGYSLYALSGTAPPKPGLVRDGGDGGIELELWALSPAAFGGFVADIPPPLGIGTIALDDGRTVKGFLCETHALANATDITAFGGWKSYLAASLKVA